MHPYPADPPGAGPAGRILFLAALALLAGLTLWVGLWKNDFPSAWHNDEPGKIHQVHRGTRNLHHPPLMLETTALVAELTGAKQEGERIARLGRSLSALWLAGAVVCVGLLAARLAGPLAGLCAGAFLGSQPLLVECAHYFKEDALHVFGLALALLAGKVFAEQPRDRARAIFLGVALAVCVSAKHSGWLLLVAMGITAALIYAVAPKPSDPPRWHLALATGLAAYLLLCLPMFLQLPAALGEIMWELRKMNAGDYGTGLPTPHTLYLWLLSAEYGYAGGLAILALVAAGVAWLCWRRGAGWRGDWAVHTATIYGLGYLLLLAFTAKFSDRYIIPLHLVISLGLAVGAARLGRWLMKPTWLRAAGPALALMALLLLLGPGRVQDLSWRLRGFAQNSHDDLERYLRRNTPPGSIIATDAMALNPKAALGSRRAILSSWFAADLGSLEELHARGVRYVAFSRDVAYRYFETDWARKALPLAFETKQGMPAQDLARVIERSPVVPVSVMDELTIPPLNLARIGFYGQLASALPDHPLPVEPPPGSVRVRLLWSQPYRDPRPLHPGLYLVELLPPLE